MAQFFDEKGAGLLLEKELEYLGRLVQSPERPFVAILGGAKVSDKIGVIQNLMPKLDGLLIGGGMAYTFLKARGVSIGRSLVEEDRVELARELIDQARGAGIAILLPVDHVAAAGRDGEPATVAENIPPGLMGLDIGPKTIELFVREIRKAKMTLWNGPVGLFEEEKVSAGTKTLARSLADSGTGSVGAGGDTGAALMSTRAADHASPLSPSRGV